jgi:hypothetical protein
MENPKIEVLCDITVELNRKQEEGLIINLEEVMDVIRKLHKEYAN